MTDALKAAIASFASEHPEYSTPDGARDKCREASGLFCTHARALGIRRALVDELDVVDGVAHKAVRVGATWVDWTARQFDASAAWPVVLEDTEGAAIYAFIDRKVFGA